MNSGHLLTRYRITDYGYTEHRAMATEGGVLGVIRASRPVLRSPADRVAYAVHAVFLSAGYSLTATGSRVSPDLPAGDDDNAEVGIEGWNDMDGAYAFQYSGVGQAGLCKSALVKCVAMGDMLMVDAAPADDKGDKEPLHLEISISDYITTSEGTNYGQLYKKLNELVEKVNSCLLSKLSAPKESPSNTGKGKDLRDRAGDESTTHVGVLVDEPPPSMHGLRYPPIPAFGSSDLLPGPGAGVFPSRVDPGVGGMLLGPNDPRWGVDVGYGRTAGFPEGGRGMIPPGARFDPFGPPGVPGFEPDRFTRIRRPPGGGTNPDLEHFQPF